MVAHEREARCTVVKKNKIKEPRRLPGEKEEDEIEEGRRKRECTNEG